MSERQEVMLNHVIKNVHTKIHITEDNVATRYRQTFVTGDAVVSVCIKAGFTRRMTELTLSTC